MNWSRICEKKKINVNAIVSYDVIEHIYDIKHHFETLGSLPRTFVVVYASSANSKNPLIVRRLRKKQIEAEYITRERTWGHKERDTLEAYFAVRKKDYCGLRPRIKSGGNRAFGSCYEGTPSRRYRKMRRRIPTEGNDFLPDC